MVAVTSVYWHQMAVCRVDLGHYAFLLQPGTLIDFVKMARRLAC